MNAMELSMNRRLPLRLVAAAALLTGAGCKRPAHRPPTTANDEAAAATPSNRVAIPATVRKNLGITFAKVEPRAVTRTLRMPGRFELLPSARREYRAPLPGRIELLVAEFERVAAGTPLYRIDSSAWRELHEEIAAAMAHADSMGPLRKAHDVHEQSLTDKVALWQERLKQLEELRAAGGGSAEQFTEARATLNQTQAELADQLEKDAELEARQKQLEAELRALRARLEQLERAGGGGRSAGDPTPTVVPEFVVHAVADGVVETLGITPGGLAAESDLIVTLVQPEQLRFRARGLQADLGVLRDGLAATIAPPQGGSIELTDTMAGTLELGLAADPDERTIDLLVRPAALAAWARAGVVAHLEIALGGGRVELAIPLSAVARDGATPILFRRDPANPDQAIRIEADLGSSDGRYVEVLSGVREGDLVIVAGNYQLMLATSGTAAKGGHFHPDGTFHAGEH
ncbi:MAG: hypothetical protein FJ293_04625 [Planctomycetes bacterium]|nr:hypothetical protein [Planctomycetota bacterium]